MKLKLGRVGRRVGWGIGDQAASSITNFGLGVVVARAVSPHDFGVFALVFGTYTVVLNAGNALMSEPFLIRYTDVSDEEWRRGAAAATGAALSLGLVAGLTSLMAGLMIGGSFGRSFVALAFVLPGLLVQDTWRTLFFACRKGFFSFVTDAVWFITMLPLLAVVATTRHPSLLWFLLAWGGVATGTAILGSVLGRTPPRIRETMAWLRSQRDLAPRFLAELMILSGAQQLAIYAIGIAAGFAAAGGIRGAEMLLGPIYVMIFGIRLMAVPEAVSLVEKSPAAMRRNLILLAAVLGAGSIAAGAAVAHFPVSLGKALLGESWVETQKALIPIALFMAATGASITALVGLRAMEEAKRSLRARLVNAFTLVAGATAGAVIGGGTSGSAWGVAIGMSVGAVAWWWELELAIREHIVSVQRKILQTAGNAEDLA